MYALIGRKVQLQLYSPLWFTISKLTLHRSYRVLTQNFTISDTIFFQMLLAQKVHFGPSANLKLSP